MGFAPLASSAWTSLLFRSEAARMSGVLLQPLRERRQTMATIRPSGPFAPSPMPEGLRAGRNKSHLKVSTERPCDLIERFDRHILRTSLDSRDGLLFCF